MSAVGLFDDDGTLRGVASWRIYDVTPRLCRGDIVAVAVAEHRRGYGRVLKQAMIAAAESTGAVAVSSIVHRRNVAMIRLNEQFDAVVENIPDDPDHCRCIIGLATP